MITRTCARRTPIMARLASTSAAGSTDVVVAGAGIVGVTAAYYLAVQHSMRVTLVDPRPPLSYTSSMSTECYRDFFPSVGDAMGLFMKRNIDLLDQHSMDSDNVFGMNRRGYVFVTADKQKLAEYKQIAQQLSGLGLGELRIHTAERSEGYSLSPHTKPGERLPVEIGGFDILEGSALIRRHFPYVTPEAVGLLHCRRCGWLSAQQLGVYMLQKARPR